MENMMGEDTILAFYYYNQFHFAKIHKTNPEIIGIVELIGHTPSSVVLNLGHFNPELQKCNVSGNATDAKLFNAFMIIGKSASSKGN